MCGNLYDSHFQISFKKPHLTINLYSMFPASSPPSSSSTANICICSSFPFSKMSPPFINSNYLHFLFFSFFQNVSTVIINSNYLHFLCFSFSKMSPPSSSTAITCISSAFSFSKMSPPSSSTAITCISSAFSFSKDIFLVSSDSSYIIIVSVFCLILS